MNCTIIGSPWVRSCFRRRYIFWQCCVVDTRTSHVLIIRMSSSSPSSLATASTASESNMKTGLKQFHHRLMEHWILPVFGITAYSVRLLQLQYSKLFLPIRCWVLLVVLQSLTAPRVEISSPRTAILPLIAPAHLWWALLMVYLISRRSARVSITVMLFPIQCEGLFIHFRYDSRLLWLLHHV